MTWKHLMIMRVHNTGMQSQAAVNAYLKSKQLLLFAFAGQPTANSGLYIIVSKRSFYTEHKSCHST